MNGKQQAPKHTSYDIVIVSGAMMGAITPLMRGIGTASRFSTGGVGLRGSEE